MRTAIKVTGFAVGLVAVFAAASGVGALVGPVGAAETDATTNGGHGSGHSGTEPAATAAPTGMTGLPGGLMVSQDGYTLDLRQRQVPRAASSPVSFRILGPDGTPVTRYTREHGQDLHLIAVRRDLTGFQHVHPSRAADGTWSIPLDLSRGGVYRVFADFTPADHHDGLTLGADLSVSGDYQPRALPPVATTAQVDGYTVALDGELVAGAESKLTLSVSQDGRPVTDLQPYLEAYGHLVALRDRDLAYLHVHPAGSPGDGSTPAGPGITFYATAPSAGAYRLFLDFRHGDVVRTAEFTVTAQPAHPGTEPSARPTAADSSAGVTPSAPATAAGHGDEPGGHGHD